MERAKAKKQEDITNKGAMTIYSNFVVYKMKSLTAKESNVMLKFFYWSWSQKEDLRTQHGFEGTSPAAKAQGFFWWPEFLAGWMQKSCSQYQICIIINNHKLFANYNSLFYYVILFVNNCIQ